MVVGELNCRVNISSVFCLYEVAAIADASKLQTTCFVKWSWGLEVMKVMKTSTEVKMVSDCKHFAWIRNESVSIIYK